MVTFNVLETNNIEMYFVWHVLALFTAPILAGPPAIPQNASAAVQQSKASVLYL